MNHTLTTPDSAIPAWNLRLKQFNDGSGKEPITLDAFLQLLHDEETARHEGALHTAMESMMRPTAAKIIAAATGDPTKLQTALEAGEVAALAALQ